MPPSCYGALARKLALALPLGLLPVTAALAADSGVDELRKELAQLRSTYEQRIAQLEERLAATERQAAPPAAETAPAAQMGPAPQPVASAASGFNPEISLILQGRYARMKNVDERHITGFASLAEHGDDHDHGMKRGFSIDHSELVLAANIDGKLRGLANFAVSDGEVEVEEAWLQTLGLGHGLTLKAGRFLSGLGYQNEQHPHAWDFADSPLVYQAMFGGHGSYGQDGLQLKWVAPTELFVELGAEIGRGANFPGTDRNGNGIGATTLFAHIGGDVGTSNSWRAGLSWLTTRPKGRHGHFDLTEAALDSFVAVDPAFAGEEAHADFDGRSRTWVADFVWRWAPDANPAQRNLKLQTEYFHRSERGSVGWHDAGEIGLAESTSYRTRQSGWYAQAVYQFMPQWRVGYRHDRLDSGSLSFGDYNGSLERADYHPRRNSVMLDYNPSEFSRFRLQLARDQSMQGLSDNQLILQYIVSLGAHGAHKF